MVNKACPLVTFIKPMVIGLVKQERDLAKWISNYLCWMLTIDCRFVNDTGNADARARIAIHVHKKGGDCWKHQSKSKIISSLIVVLRKAYAEISPENIKKIQLIDPRERRFNLRERKLFKCNV